MLFNYKADYKRCKKHIGARILYMDETCPLCSVLNKIKELNIIVDRTSEIQEKISSMAKTMERMF